MNVEEQTAFIKAHLERNFGRCAKIIFEGVRTRDQLHAIVVANLTVNLGSKIQTGLVYFYTDSNDQNVLSEAIGLAEVAI